MPSKLTVNPCQQLTRQANVSGLRESEHRSILVASSRRRSCRWHQAAIIPRTQGLTTTIVFLAYGVPTAQTSMPTPRYMAYRGGRLEVVRLLVEKEADVDKAGNRWSGTPLPIACQKGHQEIVRLLVEKGVDIDKTGNGGRTPLLIACWHGHLAVARLLFEKGADVDGAGDGGCTHPALCRVPERPPGGCAAGGGEGGTCGPGGLRWRPRDCGATWMWTSGGKWAGLQCFWCLFDSTAARAALRAKKECPRRESNPDLHGHNLSKGVPLVLYGSSIAH